MWAGKPIQLIRGSYPENALLAVPNSATVPEQGLLGRDHPIYRALQTQPQSGFWARLRPLHAYGQHHRKDAARW